MSKRPPTSLMVWANRGALEPGEQRSLLIGYHMMGNMLGLIFEAYEQMCATEDNLVKRERDILMAVNEAHKMIKNLPEWEE